jgi:hypothetical protein
MYSAHYHLLLNHLPILGTFIGLVLFVVALAVNKDDLKQASLAMFAVLALLAIPAYMSGNAAQLVIKDYPNVSMELIATHQGAAFLAFIFIEITGAFSLIGLWQFARTRPDGGTTTLGWNTLVVMLLSLATVGLMSVAGNTGGDIRHPEIAGEGIASSIGAFGASIVPVIEHFVVGSSMWIWPILEDLHFFGLILIVGTIGLLNLRVLGFLKRLPVAPLHRLLPWGIAGFVINIITGMLFFIGMPPFYSNNRDFQLKMVAMVFAGANLILFYCSGAFRTLEGIGPGEEAPMSAKFVAATSLLLWFAVLIMGRYMPFFEVLQ